MKVTYTYCDTPEKIKETYSYTVMMNTLSHIENKRNFESMRHVFDDIRFEKPSFDFILAMEKLTNKSSAVKYEQDLSEELLFGENIDKIGVKKDDQKLPLGIICQRQFPKALSKIAACTKYGNKKYKETDQFYTNFRNVPNGKERYLNAAYRHLSEAGDHLDMKDTETNLEHLHHAAWNLLALIEIIERSQDEK